MESIEQSFRGFVQTPTPEDFVQLANHLVIAGKGELHPALFTQRQTVALSLRKMSEAPIEAKHCSAYHALRLFVF